MFMYNIIYMLYIYIYIYNIIFAIICTACIMHYLQEYLAWEQSKQSPYTRSFSHLATARAPAHLNVAFIVSKASNCLKEA